MELNFTEINNNNNQNPYNVDYEEQTNTNSQKYWEQNTQQNKQPKKKKVSFDDILTNMNLTVNNKGVLQFMTPVQDPQFEYQQSPHQQTGILKKQEPLDPSVKHSYIFNKYFKDYKDVNSPAPHVKVPKTKEEYYQMLIEERNRQIQERIRISKIKSKKLMFTTNVGIPGNIQVTKNNLRKMSFG